MAHIPDGVLSLPVLALGAAATAVMVAAGLRRVTEERLPQAAALSAVFFVASLVHLPLGPSSVHLILNGLMGVVLGWAAAPAILVALLLQAVLFGFGGIVVLGVNAMNMILPALAAAALFRLLHRPDQPRRAALAGGLAGGGAVLLTALMVALSLAASGREFLAGAQLILLSALPLMVVEAVFTAAALGLIARVKPGMLGAEVPA